MRLPVIATVILCLSAEAAAQGSASAEAPKRYDVELEVAPQWATPTPFQYDTISDATAVTLTFAVKQKLFDGLSSKFTMGPAVRLDSDRDDPDRGSSFGLGAELSTDPAHGFSAFGSFGYKALFTNVFNEDAGSERTFSGGAAYKFVKSRLVCPAKEEPCPEGQTFSGRLFYSVSDSHDPLRDNESIQARIAFSTPVRWWAWFDVDATAARRWFEAVDPAFGSKQRRDDWAVNAGINFAPGVRSLFGASHKNPWLRKLKIGYTYLERDSNFSGKDKTSSSPSFAVVIGRTF